ncbi:MAG: bifunctional (p)ppGpp synthetase/guanosine-3',5'-bis(diphosphate) 3'-pyrophosphohydrolase [Geminicoccaceae bacterium]|nr:MAG: bifunctional (p)ppGpp synthetase/guanosine-3',5'-bis(diphosphate) 3'-pyrophosphohydrolase [Geminicoccaceae bacterium]
MLRQYELVEKVKAYDPQTDEDLLNRAYVFAMQAHGTQLRASGDPFFHHPVEVAGILAGLKLDSASIATGLLHDTVEDTGATIEDMERLFGREVARLVDGVTKLNKLDLRSPQSAQAENFRKLLLAMSEDIRVLLVKLADRLHNMRTLHFIKNPDKRRRIAFETMEIFAPLAERIGMEQAKAELQDLAFAELYPDQRQSIIARLGHLRRDDTGLIERIIQGLKKVLAGQGVTATVYGREKSPISIWHKMERKNVDFEQLADIMAFRVMVDDVATCYAALGAIHGAFVMVPGRFKDFISTPKPNGYRSLHTTVIGPEHRRIEVQIRTHEMHEVAELGVAAHWAYKQDSGTTEGRQYRWLRELLDILEHAASPDEFLENTKLEMFQDQVFCFTPKGDLIALPRGATPIDFAYAVHSEVGDHLQHAKIQGRIVPLRTRLDNGDQVEVVTNPKAHPNPAWLNYVVTGRARARIRRYLRTLKRAEYIQEGKLALQRAATARKVTVNDKQLEKVASLFQQGSLDDLFVSVADGSTAARQVIEAVHPRLKDDHAPPTLSQEKVRVAPITPVEAAAKGPIRGLPQGLAFHFAGCCRPIPGDAIVGVVRTGKGVVIHRGDCHVVERLQNQPQRLVEVEWAERAAKAPTRFVIHARDEPGVLGTLSTTIGNHGGNIVNLKLRPRGPNEVEMTIDVEVEGHTQVQAMAKAMLTNKAVHTLSRPS